MIYDGSVTPGPRSAGVSPFPMGAAPIFASLLTLDPGVNPLAVGETYLITVLGFSFYLLLIDLCRCTLDMPVNVLMMSVLSAYYFLCLCC